jgi:hypothetical protein
MICSSMRLRGFNTVMDLARMWVKLIPNSMDWSVSKGGFASGLFIEALTTYPRVMAVPHRTHPFRKHSTILQLVGCFRRMRSFLPPHQLLHGHRGWVARQKSRSKDLRYKIAMVYYCFQHVPEVRMVVGRDFQQCCNGRRT